MIENDLSDAGSNVKKVLDWSLPDEALKTQLWEEITNVKSGDPLIEVKLKIQGFWQKSQPDLITPYIEKFYATVQTANLSY